MVYKHTVRSFKSCFPLLNRLLFTGEVWRSFLMPMECKPADQSEVAEDKSAENVPLT